jgi:acetoin utilization deacetylase AcuC-like enzyme
VFCPQSLEAAMDAAGAVCRAVSDVCDGQTKRAFCAVRPPGHHATTTQAMGFCLFNNIFVCAQYALHQCDIKKVAIIDFDVHHGNGTDEMTRRMLKRLKNDDSSPILFISSHQFPFYPGSGGPKDNIEGAILNIPLAAGTGSQAFRAAYEQTVFPALYAFDPELIMLSAGFDAHKDDPLGELELEEDDFAWVSEKICAIADKDGGACKGRVVSVLEGGYNLGALKSAARAHLQALM